MTRPLFLNPVEYTLIMQAADVRPTQFIFINMPSVSRFDWHPISVSDALPSSDGVGQDVTLHLKAYGSWTKVNLDLFSSLDAACLVGQ